MTENEYDFQPPTNDPYQHGLTAPLWLTLLSLLATRAAWGLSAAGLIGSVFPIIGVSFLALFGVITLVVWIWGQTQMRRAAAFLASDRPLVRWTYSPFEWERLKEAAWAEEGGDWKIQLGCLTVLFAITGLITGILIGADEGVGEAIAGAALGLVGGGVFGGIIGAAVAGGNHLGVRRARAQAEPGEVALGRDEVYALGNHFKGNGKSSYVRRVTLHHDAPARLHVEIQLPPRVRGPVEAAWMLPVPPHKIEAVEEVLPMIAPESTP